MTKHERIQEATNKENILAEKILKKYIKKEVDSETVIDFVNASSLKLIWAVVFEDEEDNDLQIDIDNSLRGF